MIEDRFTNNEEAWNFGKYVWYFVWCPPSYWCQSLYAFGIAHGLPPPSVDIQQRVGNREALAFRSVKKRRNTETVCIQDGTEQNETGQWG